MKKELSFFFKLSFSIIIIFILFYKIGFGSILQTFEKINFVYIFLSIIVTIFPFLLGALNIKILTDSVVKIQFLKILRYSLLSWTIGLFVSGKIGEFSIIYFLKKEGISIGQGSAISIIDKLISALTLSLLTILCFFVFLTTIETIKLVIALGALFMIFVFFVITNIGRKFIKKYILRKYARKFAGFSKTFFYFIKHKKRILVLNFILTLSKWILNAVGIAILFLAFDTTTKFYYILLITAAKIIVGLAPFTISGLGLRESLAIFLYSLINIEPTIVAGVYIMYNIINYLFAAIIFSTTNIKRVGRTFPNMVS